MIAKVYFTILCSFSFTLSLFAQSAVSTLGNWKNDQNSHLNYLVIDKSSSGYQVGAYQYDESDESKKSLFKEFAKERGGNLYIEGKLLGMPFKGEVSQGGNSRQLILKLILKDPHKGTVRTKTLFTKDAPDPKALTSKPGYVQLWDCKECVAGSKSVRGKGPLPVQVFLRSTKMKQTQYGFEEPAMELYLDFSTQYGKYARYEVPALPKGDYEVFIQYKTKDDTFLDPLPYEPTVLHASGGMPVRLSIPRL